MLTSEASPSWTRARHADLARRLAIVAVVVGAGVRVEQFLTRRSLWLDEAMLATNIVTRDFGRLLEPLDAEQGAPILFLWAERAAVLVGGNNEYALRFIPLVAGVAVLPLVYLLGARLASPTAGAAGAALVALSPALVRYSTEVKQYASDTAIVTGLLVLAVATMDEDRRGRFVALGGLGAVAVWASHPASFAVAGIGTTLLVSRVLTRQWRALVPVVAMGAVWLTSLAALYVVSLRELGRNDALAAYWSPGFAPRPLELHSALEWLGEATVEFARDPGRLSFPILALVLFLGGIVAIARAAPVRAAVLISPLPFLVLAAVVGRYPFRGRLVLFLLPVLFVGVAVLVGRSRLAVPLGAAIALLALAPAADVARVARSPEEFADSRPVFEHIRDHRLPGDEVYLHGVATEPYRYYGPVLGITAARRIGWAPADTCRAATPDLDLRPSRGVGRVWVVFAYTLSTRPGDEVDRVRSQFDTIARRVSVFARDDASVTLYDFNEPATDPGGVRIRRSHELACLRAVAAPTQERSGLRVGPFGTGPRS